MSSGSSNLLPMSSGSACFDNLEARRGHEPTQRSKHGWSELISSGGFHIFFKAVCFFSPPVCLFGLSSHIPCWQLVWQSSGQTSYAIPRSEEADDRETGRTHCPAPFTQPFCPSPVLTPLLHHLFLPHPLLVHYLCSPRARKYFIPPTPPSCSYCRYYK